MEVLDIRYTTHFNWNWVIECCIEDIKELYLTKHQISSTSCNVQKSSYRDLYQVKYQLQSNLIKLKPIFALFRVEIQYGMIIDQVWADLQAFSFLDAKDSLYMNLVKVGKASVMPDTIVIPWDTFESDQLDSVFQQAGYNLVDMKLPYNKCLLKAATGAGGFGLYFVDTRNDVISVIKAHAKRAASYEGFLEELAASNNGIIPYWSLQRLIQPVIWTSCSCKTQIRAYVVMLGSKIYTTSKYEVRLPIWDQVDGEGEGSVWRNKVEEDLVGDGHAKPYNENRNKHDTDRVLLQEIDNLNGAEDAIAVVVQAAMSSLAPVIISSHDHQHDVYNNLAIGAIDLVVERSIDKDDEYHRNGYRAYILEINSNPAIPGKDKRMSNAYRHHIMRLVTGLMKLGLSQGHDMSNGLFHAI